MKDNQQNLKVARFVAKNYKRALYNKEVFGEYKLNELCSFNIPEEYEKRLITLFQEGVESISSYPLLTEERRNCIKGLIEKKYLDERKVSVPQLSLEYNVSTSRVYGLISDGLLIVGNYMYKEGGEMVEAIKD